MTANLDGPRGGDSFDPDRDGARLDRQMRKVAELMADHGWHTLAELAFHAQAPQASVSARVRDLRKPRYGGHTVTRRYMGDGLWQYRLERELVTMDPPAEPPPPLKPVPPWGA